MKPDKNFISYNDQVFETTTDVQAIPPDPSAWSDTVKVQKCVGSTYKRFFIYGATEDCLDVGMKTSSCLFADFKVKPTGRYVVTCKGGSNDNLFFQWELQAHGKAVDFEFGNWHSYDFSKSEGNRIAECYASDGKPITYCYRWGCKPIIISTKVKHLWWRSIGITIWWWLNYIFNRKTP